MTGHNFKIKYHFGSLTSGIDPASTLAYITIIEPRGAHVVYFTNFIRHFKRPGFRKAKFKISQGI